MCGRVVGCRGACGGAIFSSRLKVLKQRSVCLICKNPVIDSCDFAQEEESRGKFDGAVLLIKQLSTRNKSFS